MGVCLFRQKRFAKTFRVTEFEGLEIDMFNSTYHQTIRICRDSGAIAFVSCQGPNKGSM